MLFAICALILAPALAHASYDVVLKSGETMLVEDYYPDGDNVHLMRGGVEIYLPKSQIVSVTKSDATPDVYVAPTPRAGSQDSDAADGDASAPTAPAAAAPAPVELPSHTRERLRAMTREELVQEEEAASDRLLKAQQKRAEAKWRGDSPETITKLNRVFQHTQKHVSEVRETLKNQN